jgi:hypothetical protein
LKATYGGLFKFGLYGSQDIIHPYILGDKGYSFLLWLMILHKKLQMSSIHYGCILQQTSFKGEERCAKCPWDFEKDIQKTIIQKQPLH